MESTRVLMRENRWLLLALVLIGAFAVGVTSCGGGGGGSSNGEICDQCGDTDGPCQRIGFVLPGADKVETCPTPPTTGPTCVPRTLICRRQADGAQQRCYPGDPFGSDVDFSFHCKGERPGGTQRPEPVTPTPATPVPTPSRTPDPNAICGNGVIEGIEECDGSNLDDQTCDEFCPDDTGVLSCSACQFNFALCGIGGANCSR